MQEVSEIIEVGGLKTLGRLCQSHVCGFHIGVGMEVGFLACFDCSFLVIAVRQGLESWFQVGLRIEEGSI